MLLSPKPYLQKITFRPGAAIDFASYPYNIPSVRNLGELSFHPDV
ncbi:MAG: putative ATPase, partial [Verrucomicrobiaceae bacterium]|nr:putative ATPase [Verrucomicrobiaceae bacterium]